MATSEIDDSLYSRQRYMLGDNAMQRMAKSDVLLYGLNGLGVEIAKNIILAGVKSLTIFDTQNVTYKDVGTNFFLSENDIGKNRAQCCINKLSELNPYVTVSAQPVELSSVKDLSVLDSFQCVILTGAPLRTQIRLNDYCRTRELPIKFISCSVYGVFGQLFCDFGDEFEVVDANGEEPRECLIASITKENSGVVTCLENRMHGFEDGDYVNFKEIKGMERLNGQVCPIKVMSPYSFTICDTTGDNFSKYDRDGIATQFKMPKINQFESLEVQMQNPSLMEPDSYKILAPANAHIGFLALDKFQEKHNRLPNIRCTKDADGLMQIAGDVIEQSDIELESLDPMLRDLSMTCQGCLTPLCAVLGGIAAHEALVALTGKFTPINQWLYLDAKEVYSKLEDSHEESFIPRNDRYDAIRPCLGEDICAKLAELNIFMVGCGAIGCEMMKNYAMIGLGSSPAGKITITDNDLIEKSNLNRQFLFRPHHIQKPKSFVALSSTKDINPDLNIEAHQHKVCPATESTVYNDRFYSRQDIVVNALDNVQARRYVDSRCVCNQRALLESGTLGAKGHVQVIVPHLTESYSSQDDPHDEDIPYCTLKSFPANIEHCIQWARDKFELAFTQKPQQFNKFWSTNGKPVDIIQKLKDGISLDNCIQVSKLFIATPRTWNKCVEMARIKFEKLFNHKAKQLLHAFPEDTLLTDGSLFWQSPKRQPAPVEFDSSNKVHLSFIQAMSQLYARVSKISYSKDSASTDAIVRILNQVEVPRFLPSSKEIITDESVQKPAESETSGDDLVDAANRIQMVMEKMPNFSTVMAPQAFEKDDDTNGHIDFITAASNLRAQMYSIEEADKLKTKRIAGRIVPAIATTTAAIAGLVTIELIKIVKKCALPEYKNCFMNLALPYMVLSEPGPAEKTVLREGVSHTIWDKYKVIGHKDFTVQDFINYFEKNFGCKASMIVQGVKMIYVPAMPMHNKRLSHLMLKYIKPSDDKDYVDLVVSVEDMQGEDVAGPSVRYFYK